MITGRADVFLKKSSRKITMLTCYDYPTAVIEDECGIDIVLVGDSVGTNVLGYTSETEVTMEDMVHHLKAVRRGVKSAYLLADMPYKSYDNPDDALKNARIFLSQGADGVKLEGAKLEIVEHLVKNGVDVIGHLGLNPQTHAKKSVQGKTFESARQLIEDALALEGKGIKLLVLELVPEEVAKIVTERLRIPTVGIAAGRFCGGQVLVINDLLGMTLRKFRHVKEYDDMGVRISNAVNSFKSDVEGGKFPAEENAYAMDERELGKLKLWAKDLGRG